MDDEYIKLIKAKPSFIVDPNLPDRGVKRGPELASRQHDRRGVQKVQAESKDDTKEQQFFGIQCRNLTRVNKEGIKVALGSDGPIPWEGTREMADMAGMRDDAGRSHRGVDSKLRRTGECEGHRHHRGA